MIHICTALNIHHPLQLKNDYSFFKIGSGEPYIDEKSTEQLVLQLKENCYKPLFQMINDLAESYGRTFQIALSISGVAFENLTKWAPETLETIKKLVEEKTIEITCEPYYHSLSSLMSEKEFKNQTKRHMETMQNYFGEKPKTFRNAEMIFFNSLVPTLEELKIQNVLMEGSKKTLGWRSPAFLYQPINSKKINLLLNYSSITENIQYFFSERTWAEFPLTAEKFLHWVLQSRGNGEVIGLFLDAEVFGHLHTRESGIFEFFKAFVKKAFESKELLFSSPQTVQAKHQAMAKLNIENPIAWGAREKDISMWLGNSMQNASFKRLKDLEQKIIKCKDKEIKKSWQQLTATEIFYQMRTRWESDNIKMKHFNHLKIFDTPEQAFIIYNNILNDLSLTANEH